MKDTPFKTIRTLDGYLPIEDYSLIGDGDTSALVSRDGTIAWMCVPRFDSDAIFCSILDRAKGGSFVLTALDLQESRQYYLGDTAVLVTEMKTATGVVRVTDAMTLQSGAALSEGGSVARHELVRAAEVIHGHVTMQFQVEPRGGAETTLRSGGIQIRSGRQPDLDLFFTTTAGAEVLSARVPMSQGQREAFVLRWNIAYSRHQPVKPELALEGTIAAWREWIRKFRYDGPQCDLVRRSAITLKLLDHFQNGAIVAAPTSSLPESIGGVRNWDYRYAWIRDAAFSVYALHRIGFSSEAAGFLAWVMNAVERHGAPRILYNLDGEQPVAEYEDEDLEGYRRSPPVRWGNAAADQTQHDVYGEILDCAYQWASHHGALDGILWEKLRRLIELAKVKWRSPDHGIWEVRTPGRLFTYSTAMCQVALDRGSRLAEKFGLEGDVQAWRTESERIREIILNDAWDEKLQSLTEHIGGGGLDASLLALPLRRIVPADHPKMVATTKAVVERLGVGNGLLYRYRLEDSPDGLSGHEGAFLLCSFWLVDNLAGQGRLQEASDLYDSLCSRASPTGLLPEQIDPESGLFLGNYPQAFSHIGVISSGVRLARLQASSKS